MSKRNNGSTIPHEKVTEKVMQIIEDVRDEITSVRDQQKTNRAMINGIQTHRAIHSRDLHLKVESLEKRVEDLEKVFEGSPLSAEAPSGEAGGPCYESLVDQCNWQKKLRRAAVHRASQIQQEKLDMSKKVVELENALAKSQARVESLEKRESEATESRDFWRRLSRDLEKECESRQVTENSLRSAAETLRRDLDAAELFAGQELYRDGVKKARSKFLEAVYGTPSVSDGRYEVSGDATAYTASNPWADALREGRK